MADEFLALLKARARQGAGPVLARSTAAVAFDAGPSGCWTVCLRRGEITARRGLVRHLDTRIRADLPVLEAVVSGERSGVEAFLAGDLTVRGNLALALQLDGIFTELPGHPRPARFPRSQIVLAGGIRTAYLEAGPTDAPAVVLVHGLGATNASMLTTFWELARDHHVFAPDLPGHGATEAVTDRYDAPFLGRWLISFLDAVGLQRAALIGNSLGGRTTLEAALTAPDRITALVLLAPAVAFLKLRQFVPIVRVLRPELARLPFRINRRIAEVGLRRMFAVPSRLPDAWYAAAVDEFVRVMRRPSGRVAFFSALRQIYLDEAFGERGFWQRLPSLAPPALFIWGDRDRLVPAGFARHVERAVPAATSVVLPSCGHVPQFEHPERTALLVRRHLKKATGRRTPKRVSLTNRVPAPTASPV